jgi:predicted peptidase
MFQRIMFTLFVLIGLTANAQTINLRGKITNQAGNPISNAIVTLAGQSLKDTTASDGSYSITKNGVAALPFLVPQTEDIYLNRGVLEFCLPNPSQVKVEIFDVKGNLQKRELIQNASTGIYRFNIEENSRVSKLLVVKASLGQRVVTFRYLPLHDRKYVVNRTNESSTSVAENKLAKIAAINDTLKTTATGYAAKAVAITAYDTVVNISLDTAALAGHSAGCGTTPKLLKSIPRTNTAASTIKYNNVKIRGQDRRYILWYPDNYDNTHPYRLIICYHWWSGSASQVFDCTTEGIRCYTTQIPFYNLLEMSNNTTIFVAPDGSGAPLGWPNGDGVQLEFTDSILAQVKNNFCIDTTRIFAMGFSFGGGMSYAIACDRAPVFRAVCVFAGAQLSGCVDGKNPIAYYASHGVSDGTCDIKGGRALRDHFVQVNGCTAQNPPEPAAGSGQHICTDYKGCSMDHPVRWCAFDGGHDPSPKDKGQSTTWNGVEIWKFVTQF